MSSSHIVKQGEYLAMIARDYGFADYMTIWNASENAALREKRKDPNILHPGDVVQIPSRNLRTEQRATGTRHRFVVKTTRLRLRVALEDAFNDHVKNANCELRVDGETFQLKTDANGTIEHPISSNAKRAELVLRQHAGTAFTDVVLELRIGHLDPIDQLSGQVSRLTNLGYLQHAIESELDSLFLASVQEFQCDHGLQVDGKCGPLTRKKLEAVHGC